MACSDFVNLPLILCLVNLQHSNLIVTASTWCKDKFKGRIIEDTNPHFQVQQFMFENKGLLFIRFRIKIHNWRWHFSSWERVAVAFQSRGHQLWCNFDIITSLLKESSSFMQLPETKLKRACNFTPSNWLRKARN